MIRVLLAEDLHMIRGALVALLELQQDMDVVAEVDRGDVVVDVALEKRPDVAVLDIGLPSLDGLSAAGLLRASLPDVAVLMLTGLQSTGLLRRALETRVNGFVLKDAPPAELADAIRRVNAGERVIAPQLALSVWKDEPNPLTQRERDVLTLVATGAEPHEIAEQLHLAIGTVRNYLTVLVTKLNARNRLDAVRIAREVGWLR